MTKTKAVYSILVLIAGLLLSFKATGTREQGIEKGDIILTKDNGNEILTEAIEKNKGKYIILNFWSSYNAESPARNIMLSEIAKNDSNNVAMICVSFDKFESVFQETIKSDSLNNTISILVKDGFDSQTAQKYGINGKFGNFIIDPQGVIIKKNANAEAVESLIKS